MEIRQPDGNIVFSSSPAINSTSLPHIFPVNMKLGPGNYTLQVWDDDANIKGQDDNCGILTFNILSDGSLVAGGLTVDMNILHPVDTIVSRDTVVIYPQPVTPVLSASNGLEICEGTAAVLSSSYGFGNQWILNGNIIPGATDFIYQATQSGAYQVQYVSANGCVAISDVANLQIHPLPAKPVWYNYNNSLRLSDPSKLPAVYALQWYDFSAPIPGETDIWYCSNKSGTFGLEVTDLETGCKNFYAAPVVNNPNYDCLIGTKSPDMQAFDLLPNPTSGALLLRLHEPLQKEGSIRVWDVSGRLVLSQTAQAGLAELPLDLSLLNAGVYAVEILAEGIHGLGRVVKL
jgi:hypothetical protein